ncbi:uncharacterized protein LOC131255422 [Magnolia sinica]|uniref:uncharacterized protein LOC131255422 n=1 Tax=Magnolia sinica TaxID=86752 RepID=UPI00265AE2CE|nr:uncharacterized protein LOC131255422 [Magnolia sinica]
MIPTVCCLCREWKTGSYSTLWRHSILENGMLQVEDAVSRVAEGIPSAVQELDFSSLHSQLGPLAAVERTVTYNEHRPRKPPPDLLSLLLHGQIVYIGITEEEIKDKQEKIEQVENHLMSLRLELKVDYI